MTSLIRATNHIALIINVPVKNMIATCHLFNMNVIRLNKKNIIAIHG